MPKYYDQLNREINLPSVPKRIISIVPSQTELLFYLGLDEEIIGITKFCIHPADKVKKVEKVGGTKQLDIEKIKTLHPDLII
ncbi:MAG TPA: helical backbone metal receptor, partial [Mucilaginibacter sp.]|nr:helical backbone metal receptor [Mucilaginibacter sp.]